MKVYYEFPISEQPFDAFEKLVESLDDTNIWKGHLQIRKIDQNNRESVLAFRNKTQMEWIGKKREDLSVMVKYGEGPLKGFQTFQVYHNKIIIRGDVKMRGLWLPLTTFALNHILDGEIKALDRLFPSVNRRDKN